LLLTVILSFEILILFYQGWPLRLWRAAVQPVGSGGGHTTLAELAVVRRRSPPHVMATLHMIIIRSLRLIVISFIS